MGIIIDNLSIDVTIDFLFAKIQNYNHLTKENNENLIIGMFYIT